ncbi:hypothetical protein AC578_8470 [Pseudocercospora eumusae]|uniref:FAD-binding domain-containing protein n=1 Tax=Pseudocercospora eumusae TaxID=321146 RepID=A0A139GXC8_9PEZI|nr:hypothetical protein AC578_8470 [Pseudocercospora eumusae]
MPAIADEFGAPLNAGAEILTKHKVIKVDEHFERRVQLVDGSWLEGDLVIAADGIKSYIRAQIAEHHNHKNHATPTGDSAHRILVPKDEMEHDESALRLLNGGVGMRWMGPGGHVMTYPVNETVQSTITPSQNPPQPNPNPGSAKVGGYCYAGYDCEVAGI